MPPTQTGELLFGEEVGKGFTVTSACAVLIHPVAVVVPVTVYTVVDAGDTVNGFVLLPVFQEYISAPLTFNVAILLKQIEVSDNVRSGNGLTTTVAWAVLVQPVELIVPVTTYVVFDAGETVSGFALLPVFQEYISAPLTFNVAILFKHIEVFDKVRFGNGLTVTVAWAVLIHPVAVVVPVTV